MPANQFKRALRIMQLDLDPFPFPFLDIFAFAAHKALSLAFDLLD